MDAVYKVVILCFLSQQSYGVPLQARLNVLETRLSAVEMRVNMENMQTNEGFAALTQSLAALNASLEHKCEHNTGPKCDNENIKSVLNKHQLGTNTFDENVEMMKPNILPNILIAFKNEKQWLRNEIQSIRDSFTDLQERLTSETNAEFEIMKLSKIMNGVVEDITNMKAAASKRVSETENWKRDNDHALNSLEDDFRLAKSDQSELYKSVQILTNRMDNLLRCDDEWTQFKGFCYIAVHSTVNYHNARKSCEGMGATVTGIQSRSEMDFLANFVGDERIWLGMTDMVKEGQWVWERTKTPVTNANWRSGQPDNNGGNQDCAIIGWRQPWNQWNDQTCTLRHKYVCKKYAH